MDYKKLTYYSFLLILLIYMYGIIGYTALYILSTRNAKLPPILLVNLLIVVSISAMTALFVKHKNVLTKWSFLC